MRYPIEPLMRLAGCYDGSHSPDKRLAEMLGFEDLRAMHHASDFYRLKRHGLTWERADQWACALGFHPCEVWPAWLDGEPTGLGRPARPPRRSPRWGLIAAELAAS